MYDVVAGVQCLKSSYALSKTKALELFPMLKKDRLVGAIVYYDERDSVMFRRVADELPSRRAQLAALRDTEEFDVLIVGGGATGAGRTRPPVAPAPRR
ncbi:hypothetical protein CRUP_013041 [Coryphaenoides rupestris]|nr:hypothetical protein CRUP_013041 [Coryphaenoides rupestris]